MRHQPRYYASIECRVVCPDGSSVAGRVRDLSQGGICVITKSWEPVINCDVRLHHGDQRLMFPSAIRRVRRMWGITILHLSFGGLSDEQCTSLDELIAESRATHQKERPTAQAASDRQPILDRLERLSARPRRVSG
jgi:hypothetical protein